MAKTAPTSNQTLSKDEKESKEFIELGFAPHKSPWMSTAKRLLEAYNGRYYDRTANFERFTVNTIFSLVNLLLPNLIFNQPYVRCSPQQAKYIRRLSDGMLQQWDNNQAAQVREAALNHKYTQIGAIHEQRLATQDAFFYGFGITKVGYSFDTITEMDKDYVVKDSPFLKRVNPKDFGWHPLATNLADSPLLVHRSLTTIRKLKENKSYDKADLAKLKPSIPEYLEAKLNKNKGATNISDFCMLYEVHNQEKDKIYTFAGESNILLDKKDNPYHFNGSHFQMIRFAFDGEQFEGIPFLAMIEDEAMCLNEILTLMVDHYRKFPGQVFYDYGSMDDNDVEKLRTGSVGSIHGVPSTANIKFQNPLSMGGEYFSIIQVLQALIDRILGVPDFQRGGAGGSSRRSATEATIIQGDATIRRQYFLNLEKEFMLDGIDKIASLQAQFQDKDEEITASGDLRGIPVTYNKEDIQGKWAFNFDVEELLPYNEAQTQNMNMLLQTLASQPVLQPILQTLDPTKMAKVLFKSMGKNIESMQKGDIETTTFMDPKIENKMAREGKPMPAPQKGEDYEGHMKIHGEDLRTNGLNDQILEHMAETMMLQQSEQMPPEITAQPGIPPEAPGGVPGAPAGPAGPLQQA